MKLPKLVQPSEDHSCDGCSTNMVLLHHVEKLPFTRLREEGFYFCDFCYNTFAGNAAQYPDQYPQGRLMGHVCAVANILLRKLKEKP